MLRLVDMEGLLTSSDRRVDARSADRRLINLPLLLRGDCNASPTKLST